LEPVLRGSSSSVVDERTAKGRLTYAMTRVEAAQRFRYPSRVFLLVSDVLMPN
jgi:hypothetical protein